MFEAEIHVQVDIASVDDAAEYLEYIARQIRGGFVEGISEMDGRGEWQSNLIGFDS